MKFLNYFVHAAAGIIIVALVIFLLNAQRDDAAMTGFKQSLAGFITSGKPSAPLREVLGVAGTKLCISYPYDMGASGRRTVKSQLARMFPARATEFEQRTDKADVVVAIENGKDITVMTGHRNILFDGRNYTIAVLEKYGPRGDPRFGCFDFSSAVVIMNKTNFLLLGDAKRAAENNRMAEETLRKQKEVTPAKKAKPKPSPEKKRTPVRNYGY